MKSFRHCSTIMVSCALFAMPALGHGMIKKHTALSSPPIHQSGIEGKTGILAPAEHNQQHPFKVAAKTQVQKKGFFYEDFSDNTEGNGLPEGWTTTQTPGVEGDTWYAGTLQLGGDPMSGVTDYQYAYILGNRSENAKAHDAWMFSPGVYLEQGTTYQIEFYSIMLPAGEINEKLNVAIGKSPSKEGMNQVLEEIEVANDYWRWYVYEFTPGESANYYLGFNSLSPAGSNGTTIDNVMISDGNQPFFYGDGWADLGEIDNVGKHGEGYYYFCNTGEGPLTVSLVDADPAVTVKGLPVTLDKYDECFLNVSVDLNDETETFEGTFVITTNDPVLPDNIEIPVVAKVISGRVTGYILEDFETTGPDGWLFTKGAVNTSLKGATGHNGSARFFYTESWYTMLDECLDGVGFTTHYVEMGEQPQFSFWYQLADLGNNDVVIGPTPGSDVIMTIEATCDGGRNWETVYAMQPGTDTEHVASLDYAKLTVNLPTYANKTCRFRVRFNNSTYGDSYRILVDDVTIGTPSAIDLKSNVLIGPTTLSVGNEYAFTAKIQNLGSEPIDDYIVKLVDAYDGAVIGLGQAEELASGEAKDIEILWTPYAERSYGLTLVLEKEGDANIDNNTSSTWWIDVLSDESSEIAVNHGKLYQSMAYPVNFNAYHSRAQFMYYANELNINKGALSSLEFASVMETDYLSSSFDVFIGETNRNDFSDGEMIDPSQLTKVFSGKVHFQPGTNRFIIPFRNKYNYNGGNLVIMTEMHSDEFIYNKFFLVHEDKRDDMEVARSLQKSSLDKNGDLSRQTTYINCVFPEVVFHMEKADHGSVTGTVKCDDNPIENVSVSIENTKLDTRSSSNGDWNFAELAEGTYTLNFNCHGYYSKSETVVVEKDKNTVVDVALQKLPVFTLTGTVKNSTTSAAIPGVTISLDGYDSYYAITDSNGAFVINDVTGGTSDVYKASVYSPFYQRKNITLVIDELQNLDIDLDETLAPARNLKAIESNEIVMLSWEKPLPEFRHDSGEFDEPVGFEGGWEETIAANVFRRHSRIKEVRWYLHNENGSHVHSNFNVMIFGLKDGEPNKNDLLYIARNVDYVEKGWCSHVLSTPLDVDGYMVAISCDGFLSIGVDVPDEEYPFEEGQSYYAGDSYKFRISPMSTYRNAHFMIRAYGDCLEAGSDPDVARPEVEYEVCRFEEDEAESDWTILESTSATTYVDATFSNVDKGNWQYAVRAIYPSGKSEACLSQTIVKESSGVESIISDEAISIYPNPCTTSFRINNSSEIESLNIVDLNGRNVLFSDNTNDSVDVSKLSSGIYLILLHHRNGAITTLRLVKK